MNCIKIGLPGKLISERDKVFWKSYSLDNSFRESIFWENLFLYNCLQAQLEYCGAVPSLTAGEMGDLARFNEAVFGPDGLAFTPPWMKVAEGEVHSITLQSPPSPWIPTFGGVVFLICGRRKYCVVTELRKA